MDPKRGFDFAEIREGTELVQDYVVSERAYRCLRDVFGDRNPLHADEAYARRQGFEGPVMHGAILNCFVSHFVGMVFPGRPALLLSSELRYTKPVYLGASLQLRARIQQKVESQHVIVLRLVFFDSARGQSVAGGLVTVAIRDDGE
jgi:acyl dehydratase